MKRLIDSIRRVRTGFSRFDPDGDPGPPVELAGKSVLLFYLFPALGDAVLLAPAVKALLDAGAKPPIGLVLRKNAARIWKHVDLPVKILPYPEELVLPVGDAGWKNEELGPSIEKIEKRAARYDVVVDLTLRDEVDCRRFVRGSEAETRLGFVDPGETNETTGLTWGTPDQRVQGERHWSKYQILPLRCLGVREPSYDVRFKIGEKAAAEAEAAWRGHPRVLLVPGAQSEDKRWGEARFVGVGEWVKGRGGSVVVAGAPAEGKLVRSVVKAIGKEAATSYTKKNLETLLAVVASADVVVTNDTGPMHFAFLQNIPTIAVFTWMSPLCWGPPRKDPRFVTLNAPSSDVEDPEGVWTRAVIHYLHGLLERYG